MAEGGERAAEGGLKRGCVSEGEHPPRAFWKPMCPTRNAASFQGSVGHGGQEGGQVQTVVCRRNTWHARQKVRHLTYVQGGWESDLASAATTAGHGRRASSARQAPRYHRYRRDYSQHQRASAGTQALLRKAVGGLFHNVDPHSPHPRAGAPG